MIDTSKSSSVEQQFAGDIIFSLVEEWLQCKLESNVKVFLSDNSNTHIQPDFYSEEECIVGEIFSHIGKPKKAQDNKIANDVLKMLLLEKVKGKTFRKIIVVCDEEEEKKLKGLSALAESIRRFDIEIKRVDISEELRSQLLNAQKRQRMING